MENTIEIEESKGKNKGFTLIELLIVIVILGILAAVTVFAVRGITEKGQDSACKTEQKTILTGVEAFYANEANSTYPAVLSQLVPQYMTTEPDAANWIYDSDAVFTTDDPLTPAVEPLVITTPATTYSLVGQGECDSIAQVGA
jgi:prepilin-type N-terminal cleavage/methylation domain-containing protein